MQPRILIAHPLRIVANLEATEPRCVCRNSRCAHQPLPNFFLPIAYSLHPRDRIPADKRVEATHMAHDWQPDFEQLVDEHQSMVFSLALRMTGDRGLAEEIAQDVFLELDSNLGRMENAAHACFWLRRVAMSRSADALRRRRVRGIDLWVEMEEGHGVPQERPRLSAGRAAGATAGHASRAAARGAGSSLPGGPDAGGDCGHAARRRWPP